MNILKTTLERDGATLAVTAEYEFQREPAQRDVDGRVLVTGFTFVEFGMVTDADGHEVELTELEERVLQDEIFDGEDYE